MAPNVMSGAVGGTAPQSVENITRIAQNYEYNSSVPLRYWLRTAATLLREVGHTCCLHLEYGYYQLGTGLLTFLLNCIGPHLRTRRTR